MGAFVGANFDLVSQLSKEVKEREQELQRSKQDQAQAEAQHKHEIQDLKNEYDEKLRQLQGKNDYLKQQLEKEDDLNKQQANKISIFEQQLKDLQLASTTYSFSKFTGKEFKQLAYRIHDHYYQGMINLFKGFNEMQELYNAFEHQPSLLHDHNKRRKEATRAYDNIIHWEKYIKDKPDDLPISDTFKLKKIEVSVETWENVCDLVESIIKDGQVACKKRWFASKTLLCYLDLPLLDLIDEVMPLKFKLEQIEHDFPKVKEQILEITQLSMDEIKQWIETPLASLMRIDLFLKEWAKIKKKEIASLICKAELHLEHAQFRDIQDLMDAFSKWRSTLGKS